jgi:hypothetical protein
MTKRKPKTVFVIDIRTVKQLRKELPPAAVQDDQFLPYVNTLRVHPTHGYPWLICPECKGTGRCDSHGCYYCTNASGVVHANNARPHPIKAAR